MRHLKTTTISIAAYDAKEEPVASPAGENADIVRVHAKMGKTGALTLYEFHRNPVGWGKAVEGYAWKPYRRVRGPVGWLVEDGNMIEMP